MRLIEALEIVHRASAPAGPAGTVGLATGFEPLHLETFLAAELASAVPPRRLASGERAFDDLAGNIRRAAADGCAAIAVVLEWPDVDPRLGLRRLGGWREAQLADIVVQSRERLAALAAELEAAAAHTAVVCCLPTLAPAPAFVQPPEQAGPDELALDAALAQFAVRIGTHPQMTVVSPRALDTISPPAARRSVGSELQAGFPYTLPHAAAVAELLAQALVGAPPRKGIITDLDDTLWAGIAGEVGTAGLAWDLDSGSRRHGLYQQLLGALAGTGTLVGVASRNDAGVARDGLARPDLGLDATEIFPVRTGWGRKSELIAEVLDAWNVSADAVVFVDDSAADIAEAVDALPGLHGLVFPHDDEALLPFLAELRRLCGRRRVSREDRLRLRSTREATAFRAAAGGSQERFERFLEQARGALEFRHGEDERGRGRELLAKTNQFNLRGPEAAQAGLGHPRPGAGSEFVTVDYTDRFGPLGVIATLVVAPEGSVVTVRDWAMSCRALSRRIEHHCVAHVFEHFDAEAVVFDYAPTDRNAPVREFLEALTGETLADPVRIGREQFATRSPPLVHQVREAGGG